MKEKTHYKPTLYVNQERFDWNAHIPVLKDLANEMTLYLGTVRRIGQSRHALLGPIGKLLRKAAVLPFPDEDLYTNEILQAHEQGGKYFVSEESRKHIMIVSKDLASLLRDVPRTRHRKILELLGDMVYAKQRIKYLEELSKRSDYLRQKLDAKELEKLEKDYKLTENRLITKSFVNSMKKADQALKDKLSELLEEFSKTQGIEIDETPDETAGEE